MISKRIRFVLLLIISINIVIFISYLSTYGLESIQIHDSAVFDLSQWDFESNGIVSLEGKWEVYWNQLLAPSDFKTENLPVKTGLFLVPSNWRNYIVDGKKLPAKGYATYRAVIKVKKDSKEWLQNLYLNANRIGAAYKIWINDSLVLEVGRVGVSNEEYKPFSSEKNIEIILDREENEIIAQISNFHLYSGGFVNPISIGTEESIQKETQKRLSINMFMAGAFLFIALYHFGFYFIRRKDLSVFYFGLFCMVVFLRCFLISSAFTFVFRENLAFYIQNRLGPMGGVLAPQIYVIYLNYLYPEDISKKFINPLKIVFVFCLCLIILAPLDIVQLTLIIFSQTYSPVLLVYSVVSLIRIVKRKRDGAGLLLTSYLIFGILAIKEGLNILGIANTASYLIFGLFLFILAQSFLLTKRFTNAFITIEKMSQKLIRLDKVKDEFLANTSHELRTPIHGIIGIAESLVYGSNGKLSKYLIENLNLIIYSGKRLANLVNDILDISKLKNHEISINIQAVNIFELTETVLKICDTLIEEKSVELKNEIANEFGYIYADEDRMQQIMFNLIGNAIKFTEQGIVKVGATNFKDYVEIFVEDTGIGIPKDKHEEIFKSFEQVESSAIRQFSGTGLGLSITSYLVNLHGGKIRVESELGRGSKFYITIPKLLEQEVEKQENTKAKKAANSSICLIQNDEESSNIEIIATENSYNINSQSIGTGRILVVDDEKINLQVLQNLLMLHGFFVDTARNGQDALKYINDNEYEIVLLDVMMPKLSGYEVCKIIREKKSLYELPVIMLTAKNQVINIVTGLDAGANDYIIKPFDGRELLARVNTLITLKNAVKEAVDNACMLKVEREERILLEELTQKLNASNNELIETMDLLKHTQKQLILSEKMSSLGRLVSGVAHEINTPLGVCVTSISFLSSKLDVITALFNNNQIKRAELDKFFNRSNEIVSLTINNLEKVASLVNIFKKVSTDVSEEEKKVFKMKEHLENILIMLNPHLKLTSHTLKIICDEDISILSYPGSISQIVTNLVLNSLMHGFDYEQAGNITLESYENNNKIFIIFSDDGKGISTENLTRIFDPFFTTNRNDGGIGLGLSIVYNVVTQKLGGNIDCVSVQGSGTRFVIDFPVET